MRVPGSGPIPSKIAIVGEAPGAEEERLGKPFVGGSGQLLTAILARLGVDRNSVYITNVVKTRPPSNNFGVYYEDPQKTSPSPMLRQSIAELHDELRRVRPNVTVACGEEALRATTYRRGIGKWRGSILSGYCGKVIPTHHPAYILRQYDLLSIFEHDIRRARDESESAAIVLPQHTLELQTSLARVMEFLQDILARPRPISVDIETSENHVRCLAIADSSLHALCIPFMSYNRAKASAGVISIGTGNSPTLNSHWSEEEEYAILQKLDQIFSSSTIPKILQNSPFDLQILGREFGFVFRSMTHDTMGAAHTLYAELPKSLDFLASLYTRVPYYSDYDVAIDEELWKYNCLDAVVTYEIAQAQQKELAERVLPTKWSSLDFETNHIEPAMKAMTRVSQRGVLIDTAKRDELRNKYSSEMLPLLAEFRKLSGCPDINPGSTKQLAELFYKKLGLPVQLHHKTKNPTTDENAIEILTKKAPQHERLFTILLDWKERRTLVNTFLDVALSTDNRFYTSFNVFGTVTGRCNSSSNLWGLGSNLQNIPVRAELGKPLRAMFISDPGFTLIKCDLSQAEFRLVVWFAAIRRLIDKYLQDPSYDCHKWVASLIYKKAESEIVKKERDIAKNGVYGGNYAMQPKRAAQVYKLELSLATWVLDEYRKAIPEIPLWWKKIEGKLNQTRQLQNPLGRIRIFLDRLESGTYRDAYSHSCQSVVADIVHRASYLSELIFDPTECHVLMQIHDELVWQCRTERLKHYLPIIRNLMEYPLTIEGVPEPLVIPADLGTGPNWLDIKKWESSKGDKP